MYMAIPSSFICNTAFIWGFSKLRLYFLKSLWCCLGRHWWHFCSCMVTPEFSILFRLYSFYCHVHVSISKYVLHLLFTFWAGLLSVQMWCSLLCSYIFHPCLICVYSCFLCWSRSCLLTIIMHWTWLLSDCSMHTGMAVWRKWHCAILEMKMVRQW